MKRGKHLLFYIPGALVPAEGKVCRVLKKKMKKKGKEGQEQEEQERKK